MGNLKQGYRKLKTLARALDFNSDRRAAEYIYETWHNGNRRYSGEMFRALNQWDQAQALYFIRESGIEASAVLDCVIEWLEGGR